MIAPLQLAQNEITSRAIDESLIGVAIEAALDIEFDHVTREVVATPLDDALGKRYTRFGHQVRANEAVGGAK